MRQLNIHIVIPAHNEAEVIGQMLQSLVSQSRLAKQVIIVDDNSTDDTFKVASGFAAKHEFIDVIKQQSTRTHMPGAKVINAFYKGYKAISTDYDIICKFDADIILPTNYLERIEEMFLSDNKIGMASGVLHIKENVHWIFENIAKKSHIRGPIKAYRKGCFEAIGGLRKSIGWDTVDVLLASYHGWKTKTDEQLIVKHLKPTGAKYSNKGYTKQGEAMYKMRYGKTITIIAALKMAFNKQDYSVFKGYIEGFTKAKRSKMLFITTKKEGQYIRRYRWKGIFSTIFK